MQQFEMIMAGLFSFLSKFSGLADKSVSAKQSSPAEIFERFRNLLRSNNKALEIIADMGEKLGGQYIFDNHYITTSVHGLTSAVHNSVDILNTLDSAHHVLYPVHQRLKDQLEAILNGEDDRQGPRIIAMDEIGPLQWSIVGGKMAHLAEIKAKLNLDVPPGFVITTGSYHDLIEFNELSGLVERFEKLWEDPSSDPEVFEAVRAELWNAIARAQAPPKFIDLLTTTLDDMASANSGPFSLAVRSSGREEDLDFSFAGQFRSILHVPPAPEPVFNAYREVVQSLFDLESVCYRRRIFPDMGGMSIACGCQRMIDSAVSGVIHTVDPSELGKEILIVVGAPGQGAGVVEGEIPVDTFQIRKSTVPEIVSRYINKKTMAFFPSATWGLERRSLSDEQVERSCLDDTQLGELARRAMQLENYFKRPQDIEWTFDKEGKLHLLQSRPLMVLSTNKDREHLPASLQSYEQLSADRGRVAQQGIAAGQVFVVLTADDLQRFPDGAILVSRSDSSRFVKVMHRA
ncbi:MAG: PEP/pyruvate-binding domain-containing protein, partial [Desulfobulbaceae bacterium]|nr:PEP/pyruvate-binding domain-containing protein [Desulfobulbaceae bacterium]